MTERKGGLGRGLAALIPSGPPPTAPGTISAPVGHLAAGATLTVDNRTMNMVDGAIYREVSVDAIEPNPKQPRQVFDDESLAELEHSIREFGLLQPIVVRETGGNHYELVMGERRWRASQRAGLDVIPAIVRSTTDDAMLRDALLENIHRVQLNPLEEAAAYQQLLEEFGATHEELATRIGRSRPVITNMIRLDHTHVETAFRQYETAASARVKKGIVDNVCLALEIHAQLEEEIFYPAMREVADTEALRKAGPEHNEMRQLIGRLRGMGPSDPAYDDTFFELARIVMHHAAEEETQLLPAAERLLPGRLQEMGARMTRRRPISAIPAKNSAVSRHCASSAMRNGLRLASCSRPTIRRPTASGCSARPTVRCSNRCCSPARPGSMRASPRSFRCST